MRTLINAVDEAGAVLAVAQRTAKLLSGLAKELGANCFTNEKLLRARLELAGVDKPLARCLAEVKRQADENVCRPCHGGPTTFEPITEG